MPFSKKIVLDTNFLLIPGQLRVDIFEEIQRISDFNYELFIFEKTEKELENILKNGNLKDKTAAKIAKSLIKIKKIGILKGNNDLYVDEQIVEFAEKNQDVIIATQDLGLKKKLKNAKLIVLKNKTHLGFA